jgi:hypothetical protein
LLVEESVTNREETLPPQGKNWFPFWWCLPALLGFLAFILAFPIDRRIPHWFPVNIAELFTLWFLFITPVTTIVATVTLVKGKRTGRMAPLATLLTWIAIAASLVVNALVLLGMWASTY